MQSTLTRSEKSPFLSDRKHNKVLVVIQRTFYASFSYHVAKLILRCLHMPTRVCKLEFVV